MYDEDKLDTRKLKANKKENLILLGYAPSCRFLLNQPLFLYFADLQLAGPRLAGTKGKGHLPLKLLPLRVPINNSSTTGLRPID